MRNHLVTAFTLLLCIYPLYAYQGIGGNAGMGGKAGFGGGATAPAGAALVQHGGDAYASAASWPKTGLTATSLHQMFSVKVWVQNTSDIPSSVVMTPSNTALTQNACQTGLNAKTRCTFSLCDTVANDTGFTVTLPSAAAGSAAYINYSGMKTTACHDVTNTTSGTGVATPWNSTTITLAQNNEVLFGDIENLDSSTKTFTTNNPCNGHNWTIFASALVIAGGESDGYGDVIVSDGVASYFCGNTTPNGNANMPGISAFKVGP